MTAGTIVVPIAPSQRPYWSLHLQAFGAAVQAVLAILADGGGLAAQRYAARRHQAHPVWAAWALAEARMLAGQPSDEPLRPMVVSAGGELPLALPERPWLTLGGSMWPVGRWQLEWGPDRLLFHGAATPTAEGSGGGEFWQRLKAAVSRRSSWWLPVVGVPLIVAPLAHGQAEPEDASRRAGITYEAAHGETLRLIAKRLWGEPRAWPILWQANRDQLRNPGFLAAGTRLVIPAETPRPVAVAKPPYRVQAGDTLWDIAGKVYGDSWAWPIVWGANRRAVRDPHWIYPQQRFDYPTQGDVYVIQLGDSLSRIAERQYGSEQHWQRIWQANKGWLQDPDLLPVGYRLWLPER